MSSIKVVAHGTWSCYVGEKCRCVECRAMAAAYQRTRRRNKPEVVSKNRAHSTNYYKRMRDYVNTKKDKPCNDCGIKYPSYVMHFDHLGVEPKLFTVSRLGGKNRIDAEIKKCELVCANCHAERTHQRLDKVLD